MLPKELQEKYIAIKPQIDARLADFAAVKPEDYFYELCFCICTPQSKAKSALQVQHKLQARDFQNKPFDASDILSTPEHYIRFHNQKAKRLIEMQENYDFIFQMLMSDIPNEDKRMWLNTNVKGIGMKEAGHFLRNIGYRDLAILDRHILRNLALCGGIDEVPQMGSIKKYLEIEIKFKAFADKVSIPIDELDLLFWFDNAGEIIK
jgi:N-glycosylase/DNA lyase